MDFNKEQYQTKWNLNYVKGKKQSCKRSNNHRSGWLNQQCEEQIPPEPFRFCLKIQQKKAITTDFAQSSDSWETEHAEQLHRGLKNIDNM